MEEGQLIKKSGGMGVTGFVLALITFPLMFIPVINLFGFIPWTLGLIFSGVGMGKQRENRNLAIAGLIVSLLSTLVFLLMNVIFVGASAASAASA